MRDPKRIERILGKIEKIWKKCPDLRLCQLLDYLSDEDMFYYEDSWLEEKLDKKLR
jgi:uncharacterized protein YihD (DUF1040 family)